MYYIKMGLKLITLVISTGIITFCFFYDGNHVELNKKKVFIVNDITEDVIFDKLSDNTLNGGIEAYSNIINNMLDYGYELERSEIGEDYMDFIMHRGDEIYRIYFDSPGVITSIASPYDRSNVPLAYINE